MTKPTKRKRCAICGELKVFSEYSPCKTGRHGLYNYCKPCRNEYLKSLNPNREEIERTRSQRIGLKSLGLKTCSSCKTVKHLDDFYADPRHKDGKQSVCKECWSQKSNEFRLRKEYGMTPEEFKLLLDAQDGVCAICGRAPKNTKFNIDHDHKTHKIRALLCVNCNTNLLPYVERFPEWVKKAFDYLENPPAFAVIGEKIVPETNQSRLKVRKGAWDVQQDRQSQ